jgi:hypothetical protein
MEISKIKRSGVDARHRLPEEEMGEEGKYLECEVVEEQPLVWIKKSSLTHGTVMLYHGETWAPACLNSPRNWNTDDRSTIRLVLENSSSTPVDLIKLSFDDSTAREAQAVIQEGELSPEHAYELDWDQKYQPALTWENPDETTIAPGGRVTLLVKCLGKVGW